MVMRLGLVTYNIAADWDLPKILAHCQETGILGVELRTTHAHGVEPSLSRARRQEVRELFANSPVTLIGLGTTCEFHAVEPETVRWNIEGAKMFARLAHDLGATGIKVRPNGLQLEAGIPKEKTLEQIGLALRECGTFAQDLGVEVWLEVHGRDTAEPEHIHRIMQVADHPSVYVCWNSNAQDVKDGSVKWSYSLLRSRIRHVHINQLHTDYPWRELFTLLRKDNYAGWLCAEIPASPDPVTVLKYYRALFHTLAE
jgi:sugar phosphate isomerase/epimerase